MTPTSEENTSYADSRRPEVALITNHGYAGAEIPVGGAPDTGGQNFYVNTLALKLERLGYRVTIFARGGFPHFDGTSMRTGMEFLSEFVRYVFIPGGGAEFIAKEDIAIALDEEVEWLEAFVRDEADARGCDPWEVYEFINSHYWDAGVIAVRLVERWRDDAVARAMASLLEYCVPPDELELMESLRHARALGSSPGFHLGRLLIHHFALRHDELDHQVRAAASTWATQRRLRPEEENALVDQVNRSVATHEDADAPMRRLIAADALGQRILALCPEVDERLKRNLERVNRHVWTPHSLGELKDFNFHGRNPAVRRSLKFCERRNHERVVAAGSRAVVATSAKIADRLWVHYRAPVADTFYFPPCVDGDVFRPYSEEEIAPTYEYLAERTGLEIEQIRSSCIVFETSRMDRTKRKDLLLSAFAQLTDRHPESLLFIGGGPENEHFEYLENQLDETPALRGRAFLLRAIPDAHLGPMFSIADIYASASEMEGFGMSVSQAAAAGTAIVSSDWIPFSLHHAPTDCELFPAGDTDAMAAAMDRLLSNPDEREQRAERLREVARGLDWTRKAADFLGYLRRHGFEITEGLDNDR